MQVDVGETFAIRVLAWLAEDAERIGPFFAASGLGPGDVAGSLRTSEGLAAVMDYVLSDDALVLAATEALGTAPEEVLRHRAALPGGDLPHWT